MKPIRLILLLLTAVGFSTQSCKEDFLDYTPQGALSEEVLATKAGVTSLLIGAYAALDGQGAYGGNISGGTAWATPPDNWIYGSEYGGEAHANALATSIEATNAFFNEKWKADYAGVSRCNAVLRVVVKANDMTDAEKNNVIGQARFLRGYFYFDLKKMFNMVPWIDETMTEYKQPNDKDIWPNVMADFKFGMDNMPEIQKDAASANKWAAAAFLAKSYLYQHKYAEAKALFDQVITSGKTAKGLAYDLNPEFEDNYRPEKELTSPEALFSVEMSANVGNGTIATANQGSMLNFPINSPFRCCGNFMPSFDLVNSFRTNPATGLPYLDEYNANAIKSDQGILSTQPFTPDAGTVDPRLDWTAGRRGLPFKDWGLMPGQAWIRNQSATGPYVNLKNIYWKATSDKYYDGISWAPGSAINYIVIGFADVLLMAAETEVQLGNLDKAQTYVNRVRNRAANPAGFLYKYLDDAKPEAGFSKTPAANYKVAPYPTGTFAAGGKDFALKAVYFERKLELAMQGHRFFDLVRWGIADKMLNSYYAYESKLVTETIGMSFIPNKNEYYPIPQAQIDISTINGKPTLIQNPGYK
ncbi:RagB/SusD family nutrient uptake outer membrane protein [Larkinella sp. C7]|jgi:tetratricopeptide (TPR) repeat protein|uniref:RagB/SusD family nutrient uptake outer membrane protein n=1 Tax=Larkinella sp. C7 TaxID=2576607 RepID=UPI0011111523|nr:RagB/SusD family nutrient uptake outer membrane protein [Larkinella sp. C7]